MAASDDDGTAERLAQTRAQRRHVRRLYTAGRRDAANERAAERDAEREAETGLDPLTIPSSSGDTRELLAAEQDALALERGTLGADRNADDGIAMDI